VRRIFIIPLLLILLPRCNEKESGFETYDVVVYGGTSAGVITAYATRMLGKSVIVIHHGNRLGGMTSGGLGQTDIGNKYAVTGLARDFYRQLGDHYGQFESWKFEPKEALKVFQHYIEKAGIPVIYDHGIVGVKKNGPHILSIEIDSTDENKRGNTMMIRGRTFVDCSYEGDLMAKAGVSYTIGRESNEKYGETLNGIQLRQYHQFPDGVDPYVIPGDPDSGLLWGISGEELKPTGTGDLKVQTYNFRICLTSNPGNQISITRPEGYDSTRYELLVRLFDAQPEKRTLNDYFIWSLMPNHKTDINNKGAFSTDMIGMNYDYPETGWTERQRIIKDHEIYTKGLLYFFGNDPRVPAELREEMSNWGYPEDEYKEQGYWTPQLYIREARRMVGSYVMTEHHCLGDSIVKDPVALAAYTMDSHNCQRIVLNGMVKNEGDVEVGEFPPYPISYQSLVPVEKECDNLIVPVCLSASHIAYGSIRMEPVFMVLGQVSAIAASLSIDRKIQVQKVNFEEIVQAMEQNPLMDGTPPDILVDNEDKNVDYCGDWKQERHFMRNYKNSLMMNNHPDHGDYFRFNFSSDIGTKYDLYFYCPLYNPESFREDYPHGIHLVVDYAGEEATVEVNYGENIGDWAYLGEYFFDKDQQHSVTLIATEGVPALIADAILLVPSKH
jgi:hypothetical protein